MEGINLLRPGMFSVQVAADSRRVEFDCKNEVIVANKIPVDFVFIGDSITHKWELNAYFGRTGRLVLNRGIGGDTSEYVLKRFEADVLQLKPACCVMLIGINDSWAMEPDISARYMGDTADIVECKVRRNLTAITDLAVKRGQKLAICSLMPSNVITAVRNIERNEFVSSINEFIKELCKDNGVIYADYHPHFLDASGTTVRDGLTFDGLHPNVYGYNIMADVLRKTLAQYGIEI
jgi:Lysophospholipase L1 and related esterases